jgi:hypothetical protein
MSDLKAGAWRTFFLIVLIALPARAEDNVVISEFMAANTSGLRDDDNHYSDWIEIHNAGTNTVNLDGWILRDSNNEWTFPPTNIGSGHFIIVFASGKDRRIPGRPLHTDFGLSSSGEYLALIKPDGTNIVTEFDTYPGQLPNISYGLSQTVHYL